jgi:hypothetical protein
MTTFDEILPKLGSLFARYKDALSASSPIYLNRDLNGRVRLVIDEKVRTDASISSALAAIVQSMPTLLGPHAYPPEQALLWESDIGSVIQGQIVFELADCQNVFVIDRLALEESWSQISAVSAAPPRIVFYSIKGGVGRSTALAVTAWALAEQGKRVMVLDLDLESPGLSSSLLGVDRRPAYGIADWLVEDLVDNGDFVARGMIAASDLSREGDIAVVPAHGGEPGEYLAKLGRAWMPKLGGDGRRESWPERLGRLIGHLESTHRPDVVLIDSRSGIDETASVCLTGLGASLILLFALEGDQTWSGYRMIFRNWLKTGVARSIRTRLQVVGAMIPELGGPDYLERLRDSAWEAFFMALYDEVPPGDNALLDDQWSFDRSDDAGPHSPWPIRWHRGFASLASLQGGMGTLDRAEITAVFGAFVDGVTRALATGSGTA